MPLCPYCCQEQEIDLHELWGSREFMVSTCCELLDEEVRWGLAEDPEWARALLQHLGIEEICGERLRRVAEDGLGALILDWQLRLDRIAFRNARRFIDRHHEHLPGPIGWRYGQGIWNGPDLLGVVTVGQPLARAFDPHQVVEVTRLCVRRDRPAALRWNACSQLYGWGSTRGAAAGLPAHHHLHPPGRGGRHASRGRLAQRRACRRPELELARPAAGRSCAALPTASLVA